MPRIPRSLRAPVPFLVALLLVRGDGGAAPPDCQPRDLGFASAGWVHRPLSRLKSDTSYAVTRDGASAVVTAVAKKSASSFVRRFPAPVPAPPVLSWRWKTDALVPGADNRDESKEDAPLRVIVAFDGDKSTLPEEEQDRFRRANRLFGKDLPFALLMYVWSDQVPAETVIPSAHTGQIRMIVVDSGTKGLGSWQSRRRHLAEDYRRAFGAAPGPVIGVAVMTDTDNTGGTATGLYADLRFECGP